MTDATMTNQLRAELRCSRAYSGDASGLFRHPRCSISVAFMMGTPRHSRSTSLNMIGEATL